MVRPRDQLVLRSLMRTMLLRLLLGLGMFWCGLSAVALGTPAYVVGTLKCLLHLTADACALREQGTCAMLHEVNAHDGALKQLRWYSVLMPRVQSKVWRHL